jgi:hypothetical protein
MKQIKHYKLALISFCLLSVTACVQKAYKKTVVVTLTIQNNKNIKTVGIRGNGNPLSWEKDYELTPIVKDSLYTTTITAVTGYKFAEIKFTVNGEFELQDKPNRRVEFAKGDTTFYNAVFNTTR